MALRNTLKTNKNYLLAPQYQVDINGAINEPAIYVPQGTVFYPAFFMLYRNSLLSMEYITRYSRNRSQKNLDNKHPGDLIIDQDTSILETRSVKWLRIIKDRHL